MKAIIHGRILAENEILRGQVLLYDEQIRRIIPEAEFDPASVAEIFDAAGQYVSPGFINMHIHGCCGVDVMDDADGALQVLPRRRVLGQPARRARAASCRRDRLSPTAT